MGTSCFKGANQQVLITNAKQRADSLYASGGGATRKMKKSLRTEALVITAVKKLRYGKMVVGGSTAPKTTSVSKYAEWPRNAER